MQEILALNSDLSGDASTGSSLKSNDNHGDCEPLASRLRPCTLNEYVGQEHLLASGKLLRRAIDSDKFSSLILAGPPGVGKTSLAYLIAKTTNSAFVRLSGVTSSVADIRREIATAIDRQIVSKRSTILFIDEIHRFNRSQQDSLLPDVEKGNIRLIGATTHNPMFYIIGALRSRSLIFQLETLSMDHIKKVLLHALSSERGFAQLNVKIDDDALDFLANICEGDARRALNALEIAVLTTKANKQKRIIISKAVAEESIQKRDVEYGADGHYDTASAFIKSMRGSDPDAAVYWLAKMLHAGEDIRFIARRIVIFASEDIGNADPRALMLATSTMQAVEMIGMPEARILLSQAVCYCACAPKSNASYLAVDSALGDVKNKRVEPVPAHLRDPNSSRGNDGKYKYPHNFANSVVEQDYLGVNKNYYKPKNIAYEEKILQRLEYWKSLREKK